MPAFLKNPKFIISAIIVAWLAYVIYANSELEPVSFRMLPFGVQLSINVSGLVVACLIAGSVLTLAGQWLWRRWRASSHDSVSATASESSTSAVR
jgi:hypothetical protein